MPAGPEWNPRTARLCDRLLRYWDPMFTKTIDPSRPRRTAAILGAFPDPPHGSLQVLEIGSGPGPLTKRILDHSPRTRVVAVDTDPVLLRVGEVALRRCSGRVGWILADVRAQKWTSALPSRRFDVAVSSMTLHWLEGKEIRSVYRTLHMLLRPGGCVVEGDFLPARGPLRTGPARDGRASRPTGTKKGVDRLPAFKAAWRAWWDAAATDPVIRASLVQRYSRLPGPMPPRRSSGPKTPKTVEFHLHALRDAGFHAPTVVWQEGGFRVLTAER